jgi:hypothetical protein
MQHVLAHRADTRMSFYLWNDLPERTFPEVETLLTSASYQARANGE